ncbi:MAG TPA: hypothetical protein VFP84_13095 [Kofleriaceae bacterium]|nr:hypothetical protein [Kofleriaceae bacterium]
MRFCPWYPLSEARDRAPAGEGVVQLRLASGLLDYPRGKSAMVFYAHAAHVADTIDAWAAAHGAAEGGSARETFVCRHLIEADPATDLAQFCAKLSDEFLRRFGAPPGLR